MFSVMSFRQSVHKRVPMWPLPMMLLVIHTSHGGRLKLVHLGTALVLVFPLFTWDPPLRPWPRCSLDILKVVHSDLTIQGLPLPPAMFKLVHYVAQTTFSQRVIGIRLKCFLVVWDFCPVMDDLTWKP